MSDVKHIPVQTAGGATSFFLGGAVSMSTPASGARTSDYDGPTGVVDRKWTTGVIAQWEAGDNLFPQKVFEDIENVNIVASVLDRKVNLLTSGGLQYGLVEYSKSGETIRHPVYDPAVQTFLDDQNIDGYLGEAAWDANALYNVFPELQMGRAYDRVVGIGTQDAGDVRLGIMDAKANTNKAYIGDWRNINNASECDAILHALDPYYRVSEQILSLKKAKYILPMRYLHGGRRYYALAPWNSLRNIGWIDFVKRIVEVKLHLADGLKHIKYHIEISERYWPLKYKDWLKKTEAEQIDCQKAEVALFNTWAKGKGGQNGVFFSKMVENEYGNNSNPSISLIKINELKNGILEGAYLPDVQEVDHIICRDMGLDPAYMGISPSKSGSSPGSGSEDRVSRTHHAMDNQRIANLITRPFEIIGKVNKWNPKYKFWLASNYVATLDRSTRSVGSGNKSEPNDPNKD